MITMKEKRELLAQQRKAGTDDEENNSDSNTNGSSPNSFTSIKSPYGTTKIITETYGYNGDS